jgi:hypothetical protein
MDVLYEFTLTGKSPLLMHRDNIEGASLIKAWQKDEKNKALSVAGDDRSPAWTWQTYLYSAENVVTVNSEAVMVALRSAGAQKALPNGKNGKTFKDATQYGIIPESEQFPLLVGGKTVPMKPITALWNDNDFAKHEKLARSLGFELFAKRAKIGQSKHIRVRPRFDEWSAVGRLMVTEDAITEAIFTDLLRIAGDRAGIGDWRPSSKTPGPYGRFGVKVERIA